MELLRVAHHVGSGNGGHVMRGESSRLSRNGVSGAAGKPLVHETLQERGGGGGLTGTLSGVSFLGWDSGERGKSPLW